MPENLNIAMVNKATVPLGGDWLAIVRALQKQVDNDWAPVWGFGANLIALDDLSDDDYWALVVVDDPTVAQALGYHETTQKGNPIGYVFAKLATRGGSVSVTISHELLEMMGNPQIRQVIQNPKDGRGYAKEMCDAIQRDEYAIDGVKVSDFVYPAYFTPGGTGKFDHLGKLKGPFTIAPGGYMPVQVGGRWTQIFGSLEAKETFEKEIHHPRTHKLQENSEILMAQQQLTLMDPQVFAAQEPKFAQQAMAFGFDWDSIKNAVQNFGPVVFDGIKKLQKLGVALETAYDMVTKFEPQVIDFLDDWFTAGRPMMAMALQAGIPSGLGGILVPFIIRNFGFSLIRNLIPQQYQSAFDDIIARYGDQILNWILTTIGQQQSQPAVVPSVA